MTESGDGQAVVTAATSDPSAAISAYNDGGTMYFYSGDDMVSKKNHSVSEKVYNIMLNPRFGCRVQKCLSIL